MDVEGSWLLERSAMYASAFVRRGQHRSSLSWVSRYVMLRVYADGSLLAKSPCTPRLSLSMLL
jgi:hypothetical protein